MQIYGLHETLIKGLSNGVSHPEPNHRCSQKLKSGSKPVPSGELTFCHGKSPFLMGKSTISMAIFNSFLYVHQRVASKKLIKL